MTEVETESVFKKELFLRAWTVNAQAIKMFKYGDCNIFGTSKLTWKGVS